MGVVSVFFGTIAYRLKGFAINVSGGAVNYTGIMHVSLINWYNVYLYRAFISGVGHLSDAPQLAPVLLIAPVRRPNRNPKRII